jgi:hypothetical protein
MTQLDKYVKSVTGSVVADLRVSSKFLLALVKEDDWSFIIKSHALVEATISELLTTKTTDDRLMPVFRRMELSNETTGKLAFAKALNLLTREQRSFVRTLSQLRNLLVHNVENVTFSLDEYVSAFDDNQKRSWQNAIVWFPLDKADELAWHLLAIRTPKLAIWMATFLLVGLAQLDTVEIREHHRLAKLACRSGLIAVKELPQRSRKSKTAIAITTRSSRPAKRAVDSAKES